VRDLDRLLAKARNSPNNFRFRDLCRLAELAGFVLERRRGTSHLQYRHRRFGIRIALQEAKNGQAKPYQIRRIVAFIEEHFL
jgi:predicted RNA binding protein YcfA (HicA-like mRNA interferase family)